MEPPALTQVIPGSLYLGCKRAAADAACLQAAGVSHVLVLTTEAHRPHEELVAYSHCPPLNGNMGVSHADAVGWLRSCCDSLDAAALAHGGAGAVLVSCARGPGGGGASGAVGATHLLLSGGCSTLAEALARCGALHVRGRDRKEGGNEGGTEGGTGGRARAARRTQQGRAFLTALWALELQLRRGAASDLPLEDAAHWALEPGDAAAEALPPPPEPIDDAAARPAAAADRRGRAPRPAARCHQIEARSTLIG